MYPRTWHRPKVVRLEQQHRVTNIRIGDLLMAKATSLIKPPAQSSDEYAERLNQACRVLLNAQTHYMEAGLRRMAEMVGGFRHELRDIEAGVRGIERQGGR